MPAKFFFSLHCRHFSQLRQYGCYAVMLLLPLISRTILKTFRCIEYDSEDPYSEKQRVLFADHNVNCNSEAYLAMEIYAVANVIIWTIGVPVGLMIWLRSLSIYLDPVGMTEEEAIAVRRTDEHIKSSAVAFLALYHKPRYWYVINIWGRKESPFCLIAASQSYCVDVASPVTLHESGTTNSSSISRGGSCSHASCLRSKVAALSFALFLL